MKFLSTQTFQCGITVQGSTTLAGTTYLTGITNTASWDYVVVGTSAQGQLFTRTYAQLMSDISSGITLSLDGLSDVVAPTPLTGQLLRYNGVQWANWTPTYYSLPAGGTTLQYIDGTGALQTFPINLPTSSVKHQVKAGVAINKGQAVYVTSADGTNMIVGLASNASEATSSKTMGLLDATVSTNGFANVVTEGLLAGLDTSTAGAAGDPVWLGTGGNLIYGLINKPYAPAHLVFIGIVTRKNNSNGEIFVKVQNGFELDELHDVDLKTNSPTAGQLLRYNSDGLWKNWSPNYLTAEADTLATVTGRGATTNTSITVGPDLIVQADGSVNYTASRLWLNSHNNYRGAGVHMTGVGSTWFAGTPYTDFDGGYVIARTGTSNDVSSAQYSNALLTVKSSGNVGIGTSSPSYKLDVQGDISVGVSGATTVHTYYNSTTRNQIVYTNNSSFEFHEGANERVRIAAGGNVGIGTNNPTYKLDLVGSYKQTQATGGIGLYHITSANADQVRGVWDFYTNTAVAADFFGRFGFKFEGGVTDTFKQFQVHVADASVPKLVVAGSGNVGIGTITPTTKLHVVGTVTATAIQLNTGSGDYYINGSNNTLRIGSLSTTNKIQLELFHSVNPVSLGISYNGGEALPYIESVHPSYDVNTHLLFKPGGTENWRIGSHGSNHIYGSAFVIKPASNNYDFYLANSSGTALFYSDTSTGSIGIGTTSPASRLQIGSVGSTGYSVGNGLAFGDGTRAGALNVDSNGTTLYSSTNLIFSPGTTEAVRITSAGNVGIGTTSPAYTLDVNGTLRTNDRAYIGEDVTFTSAQYYYLISPSADGQVTFTNSTVTNGQAQGFFGGELSLAGTQPYINHRAINIVTTVRNTSTSNIAVAFYASGRTGNTGAANKVAGFLGGVNIEGSGNVTNAIGLEVEILSQTNNKTITNMYGVKVQPLINSVGTITNTYGLYIDSLTAGTQTNAAYGIYQAGTDKNYFGGNVGIGTTDPQRKLDSYTVGGAFTGNNYVRFGVGAAGAYGGNNHLEFSYNDYGNLGGRAFDNIVAKIQANTEVVSATDVGGTLIFSTKATGGTYLTAPLERMRITSGGNIGVGTASPTTILDIQPSSGTPVFRIARTGGADVRIGASVTATGGLIGTYTASPFSIYTNSSAKVTITSDGSVGIGTTSPNSSARLHLSGATTSPSLNTTNPANITAIFSNSDPSYGTMFATDPTGKGLIQQRRTDSATYYDLLLQPYGGNVGIGTTNPNVTLEANGIIRSDRVGVASQYVQINGGDAAGPFITAAGAAKVLTIQNNSTTSSDIYFDQAVASTYQFKQATVTKMILDASGNVGIGTTSPNS
jgi:hypothetical protein